MEEQKEIWYKDIKALGFTSAGSHDQVFFDHYGFPYYIVTLQPVKDIIFEWDTVERTVRKIRVDTSKEHEGSILGEIPIMDLDHLKRELEFYGAYTFPKPDYTTLA